MSTNSVELRRLTADQLPAVVALDQCCLGGLWNLDGYQREVSSPNSDLLILRCPDDPQLDPALSSLVGIGCLWAIVNEAHITLLGIHPNYQRIGLGQLLLVALLTAAHRRRLDWATLEVRDSNHAALNLYAKFGFETIGRRKKYYVATGDDALILWRKGVQTPEFSDQLTDWTRSVGDRLQTSGWLLQDPEQHLNR